MKRRGKLFGQFCSFENLLAASQVAQRGKREVWSTARFNFQKEQHLLKLRAALKDGNYRCGAYTNFYIYEPKKRYISAAPYVDRVVHHALCNVIGPVFERTFIHDLYSNREGKGAHKAVDQYQRFCRLNQYVLKCDIRDYFASVDKAVLFKLVERKIKDVRLLAVIKMVIESFTKDPVRPNKGMPLGNLTSQLFANLYLSPLDHFITETLGCRYFIRYCDDFVMLHNSKSRLHEVKAEIEKFLLDYKLELHPIKSRVYRVSDGIHFLGYRVFPHKRLVIKKNVRRFRRRLKQLQALYRDRVIYVKELLASLNSWNAHAGHADSYQLRQRIYSAYTFTKG